MDDDDTLETCLDMLEAMPTGRDQGSRWGQLRKLYVLAVARMQPPEARAAVEWAALNEAWRPSPARLLDIAAELASPIPDAEATYAEIARKVQTEGPYGQPDPDRPTVKLEGPPPFSHPVVEKVVHYCGGWPMVCGGESNFSEGLKKQVRSAHESIAREWRETVKSQLVLPVLRRDRRSFPTWKPFALPADWTPEYLLPAIAPPAVTTPDLAHIRGIPESVRKQIEALREDVDMPVKVEQPAVSRGDLARAAAELREHRAKLRPDQVTVLETVGMKTKRESEESK